MADDWAPVQAHDDWAPIAPPTPSEDWQPVEPSAGFLTPFKALATGVVKGTGKVVGGVGLERQKQGYDVQKAMDAIDAGKPFDDQNAVTALVAPSMEHLFIQKYQSNPEMRAQLRTKAAELFDGQGTRDTATTIQNFADTTMPASPAEQASKWYRAPEMIGEAAPAIAAMVGTRGLVAPEIGTLLGGATMAAQGADQGFADALAGGADVETAYKAAYGQAAIQGGLGALPLGYVLGTADRASGNLLSRTLVGAAKMGGAQSVVGAVQQFLSNLQAKGLYDPERGLSDNVPEAALMSAITGAVTGAAVGATMRPGGGGRGAPSESGPAAPEGPLAISGPPEPPASPAGPRPAVDAEFTPVEPPALGKTPGAAPPEPGTPPMNAPVAIEQMVGQPVGLKSASGAPARAVVEAVQDGYVFYRTEDGNVHGAAVPEFTRDLTTAPPASGRPGNPTTVPVAPNTGAVPLPGVDDMNDFNPWHEEPSAPGPVRQPNPQAPLDLPDTRSADAMVKRAVDLERQIALSEAGHPDAVAKTPEQLAVMKRMSAELQDQAASLMARVEPAQTGPAGSIGPGAVPKPLGPLSAATQNIPTEATTGPVPATTTRPASPAARVQEGAAGPAPAPLLGAKLRASEATTGPLARPDTTTGQLLPISRTVGPETEASGTLPAVQTPEAPKPTLTDLIGRREAILNNPAKLARQLGVPVEEAARQLQAAAANPNIPIRQVRGSVKTDAKTGAVTQSKMAGRYVYGAPPQNRNTSGSLLESLSRAGGIQDPGGDLASMGAGRWHIGKPGRRNLINPNGRSMDDVKQMMAENGYLAVNPGESASQVYSDNDVREMIGRELGGNVQLPLDQAPAERSYAEPDPEQIQHADLTHSLSRLGEQPVGHTIEDLIAQLDERLAMIGAASVDDAVRMIDQEEARMMAALPPEARQAVMEVSDDADWATLPGWGDAEGFAPPARIEAGQPEPGPVAGQPGAVATGGHDAAAAERGAGQEVAPRGGATERTDQGENYVIPGTEGSAQQALEAQPERMRSDVAQRGADENGLFGDGHKQTDIFKSGEGPASSDPATVDQTSDFVSFADRNGGVGKSAAPWVIQQGRATGKEHLVSYDVDIDTVLSASTSEDSAAVRPTLELMQRMSVGPRTVTVVHNHPTGSPLSTGDLRWLAGAGLAKVAAYGNDGAASEASLSLPIRMALDDIGDHTAATNILMPILNRANDLAQTVLEAQTGQTIAYPEFRNRLLAAVGILDYRSSHPDPLADVENSQSVFTVTANRLRVQLESAGYPLEDTENAGRSFLGLHRRTQRIRPIAGIENFRERDEGAEATDATGQRLDRSVSGDNRQVDQAGTNDPVAALPEKDFWANDEGALNLGRLIRIGRARTPDAAATEAARLARDTKPGTLQELGLANAFMTMPAALASRDNVSARYFNSLLKQHRRADELENEAIPQVLPYLQLDDAAQERVNKVLEYKRLYGVTIPDTGRRIVVRIPTNRTGHGAARPALSRPNEIIALDARETAAVHQLQKFFDDRLSQMGESIARETGYEGTFDEQSIRNEMGRNDASPRERNRATRALAIWQDTVGGGRKGYVPFSRYGDKYIKILPKVTETPGRDAMPPSLADGHFEFVESSMFDKKTSGGKGPAALRARMVELRQQFPADRFDMTSGDVSDLQPTMDNINTTALERVIARMDRGEEASSAVDAVLKYVMEQRRAGFRKQSSNIPGYCVAPDTKILTADMRWVEASSLVVGQSLVGFDEFNREYRNRRKMRAGTVESIKTITRPCHRITLASGRKIVVSSEHRFLGMKAGAHSIEWVSADAVEIGASLQTFPYETARSDFDAGWFSGILDGEGWLSKRRTEAIKSQIRLGWAQLPGPVMERAVGIARSSGLNVAHHKKNGERTVESVLMGPWDAMACLQIYRPIRLMRPEKWEGSPIPTAKEKDLVIASEFIGEQTVVSIQTSTKTFISNGICSHNCTDFGRAVVDYVRHSSAMIARLENRKDVDGAYNSTQEHRASGVREYWKSHKAYMERNGNDFAPLRKVAFAHYLWGSPASAAVNLTQTAMVTAPQMAPWAGPQTVPLLGGALADMGSGLKVGPSGLYIDWSALGRTPGEKAFIDSMVRRGLFNPVIAREFASGSGPASKRLRPYSKRLARLWDIGASGFNAAEQINRYAAAMAYYRATQNRQAMGRLIAMHKNDQRFKDLMRGGMTPEKAGEWAVDETQFIGGKVNRAPMQRGIGGLALQFRPYQFNILRLFWKNLRQMGWQGKLAFGLMGAALVGTSGLYGLPFAEDADKLATEASQTITGLDPMIEMRLRQFASDAAMSVFGADQQTADWAARVAARGAARDTGVDIGARIGTGNIVPDGTIWTGIPILDTVVNRAGTFWHDVKQGRPIGAAAQLTGAFFGKGAQDVVEAAALPYEGKRTAKGDVVKFPSEITGGDIAAKASGFNPTSFSEATERRYQESRLAASTQVAASDLLRNAAAHYALSQDALQSGDTMRAQAEMEEFNRILTENAERLQNADIPDWQQIKTPTRQAMKAAIGRQLDADAARMKATGKMKREQMGVLDRLFGGQP